MEKNESGRDGKHYKKKKTTLDGTRGEDGWTKTGCTAEHVLRKIHHCTFVRKISQRPFLGFYPKILQFISKKL